MTPQTGGYIVIDCTPIWKDTDEIAYEDGEFSEYANTNQEINKIINNAIHSKKPIILNNLKIYDVANQTHYVYNGLVGYAYDSYTERGGSTGIQFITSKWEIEFSISIIQSGEYYLDITGSVKQ